MAEDFEETEPLLKQTQSSAPIETPRPSHALHPHMYSHSKWKRHGACVAILLAVMFERLTFYGFSSNLVMFLNEQPLGWLSYDAVDTSLIFVGVAYVAPVLGGLVADTLLGRFKTIVLSFVLYILGSVLFVLVGYATTDRDFQARFCGVNSSQGVNNSLAKQDDPVATVPSPITGPNLDCGWAVYVSLITIAIGTGSVKSNLSPFGGDQVRYEGPEVMRSFFNWFYWAINVGSLMALAGVTALQQNFNFFVGLLVPAASLVLAATIFVVGRTWYLSKKPMGSVLTNTSKIIIEAFKKRKVRKTIFKQQDSNELFPSRPSPSFLDMAKVRFGGSFHESLVDDVKSLKKVILVFIGLTPYWVMYFQMQTTFLLQGLHMRFETNSTMTNTTNKFQIPPAWLSLFDVIAVLLLLPLFDRVLYPRLDRLSINFSLLRRMIVGMLFSMLAMIAAGVLEHVRLTWLHDHPHGIFNQTIQTGNALTTYEAADIWIFYQIPQYTLIGISEVFASVAGLEFAYSMAPRSMQGMIMGVFFLSSGIAAFVGSGLLRIATIPGIQWLNAADDGNINNGRLDLFFYMLAAVQLVATAIFATVALLHERQEARNRVSSLAINKAHRDENRTLSVT